MRRPFRDRWRHFLTDERGFIGTAAAIASAIAAGAGVGSAALASHGASEAAKTSSDAALKAAQLDADAKAKALDFQKQQAEADWKNQEIVRKANYDQWVAQQQRKGSVASLFGLPAPSIPDYVPSVDPSYTGAAGAPAPTATGGTNTSINMPSGIDPRFAALYQKYGVTPGARGSGPADWQYYQTDAVRNANGDVNYVLGRLEQDLQKGAGGVPGGASSTSAAPGSVAAIGGWNQPLSGVPLTVGPGAPSGGGMSWAAGLTGTAGSLAALLARSGQRPTGSPGLVPGYDLGGGFPS